VRRLVIPLALIVAFTCCENVTAASIPDGARLAFTRTIQSSAAASGIRDDLMTSDPLGGQRQLVLGDTLRSPVDLVTAPSWSPDGSTLGFFAEGDTGGDVYLVGADGSGLRQLTYQGEAGAPVFSADGGSIYFSRGHGIGRGLFASPIWAIGVDGSAPRQLTVDRRQTLDGPSSVSPAGDLLAFTRARCRFHGEEHTRCRFSVRLLSLATGAETLIARRAFEPAFSPDGGEIAFAGYRGWRKGRGAVNNSDLYILDLASGTRRRLTRTRHALETAPDWDPSGQRMAFAAGGHGYRASRLFAINADGSCRTRLLGKGGRLGAGIRVSYEQPTWQPGPGREAGRIAC
jgi:Tol biopolymer transport system component